ncbi:MAG: V-type ATPase subunit [Promethearchaeota archaeon]
MPKLAYLYMIPRIRALLSFMLSKKRVDQLVDAKSPSELQSLFLPTYYGHYLEEIEEFTAEEIELVLNRHTFEVYTSISKFVTGDLAEFFNAIITMFEAENLKRILRAIDTGRPVEEIRRHIVSLGKRTQAHYLDLLAQETINKAISKMPKNKLRKTLETAYPQYEQTKKIFVLESALDRQIYTTLWKNAITWKKKSYFAVRERHLIQNLIGENIDFKNILITLRALSLGLNPKEFIVPVTYRVKNELNKAMSSEGPSYALDIFNRSPKYGPIIEEIQEKEGIDIPRLEIGFQRFHANKCRVRLADYPFQINPIYSFILIKYFEIRDLRIILVGKLEEIDPASIRRLLVFYN